jgi:hypothetical protein
MIRRQSHPKRIGIVIVLGAMTLLLAACSSGSPSAARSTTSSTAPHARTTTTTTTTQPTTPACTTAQLQVTAGMSSGAAGTIGLVVLFKNVSGALCLLHGFPGVAGLDASGNQLTQATRILSNGTPFSGSASSLPTIQLSPGTTASALVQGSDVPSGGAPSCVNYSALLVTPPNALQSVHLAASLPGCSGLRVTPVVSGTAGM